jgi:hypothetical protein
MATPSATLTVTATPTISGTLGGCTKCLHITTVDMFFKNNRVWVEVTVVDELTLPVEAAEVSGVFWDPDKNAINLAPRTTDNEGKVLWKPNFTRSGEYSLNITLITKAGYTLDSTSELTFYRNIWKP